MAAAAEVKPGGVADYRRDRRPPAVYAKFYGARVGHLSLYSHTVSYNGGYVGGHRGGGGVCKLYGSRVGYPRVLPQIIEMMLEADKGGCVFDHRGWRGGEGT